MTLILTDISRFGIIHASDSNLTDINNKNAGEGQKTFVIDFLNAGLTVAGSYNVGGRPMNIWIPEFIDRQSKGGNLTLKDFSNNMKDALQAEMTKQEKESGSIFHIAGYVEEGGLNHAEFYCINNTHGINSSTGEYKIPDENFEISEDFWNKDYKAIRQDFQNPDHNPVQLYFNGFAQGRMGFNFLQEKLGQFFYSIWQMKTSSSAWQFRPPTSLEERKLLIEVYMKIIDALFVMSDYTAHYIGGNTQTILIPQPANIVDEFKKI